MVVDDILLLSGHSMMTNFFLSTFFLKKISIEMQRRTALVDHEVERADEGERDEEDGQEG